MISFKRLPAVQLTTLNVATGTVRPGDRVSINPQPLPPRVLGRPGDEVSINPQPLPPRVSDVSVDRFEAATVRAALTGK